MSVMLVFSASHASSGISTGGKSQAADLDVILKDHRACVVGLRCNALILKKRFESYTIL